MKDHIYQVWSSFAKTDLILRSLHFPRKILERDGNFLYFCLTIFEFVMIFIKNIIMRSNFQVYFVLGNGKKKSLLQTLLQNLQMADFRVHNLSRQQRVEVSWSGFQSGTLRQLYKNIKNCQRFTVRNHWSVTGGFEVIRLQRLQRTGSMGQTFNICIRFTFIIY